ncbi:MAG: hypothetical protein JWN46_1900 [Acidimicrobiales bacterium]|nr:hypothetical protein [Acidimicrobiales bacterium]
MPGPDDADEERGDHLGRWLAEQRVDQAAAERRREGWMRRIAAEEGTLAGVLVDLAEREGPVVVHVTTGRRHRGVIRTVGGDFIGLCTEADQSLLVRIDAIASVRPEPAAAPSIGRRALHVEVTLGDVLGDLVGDRPRVFAVTSDGAGIGGTLRSVGRDLLVVRPDSGLGWIYLGLAAVAEVVLT